MNRGALAECTQIVSNVDSYPDLSITGIMVFCEPHALHRVSTNMGSSINSKLVCSAPNPITDGVTYSFGVFYIKFLDYFQEGKGATAWIASILVGVTLCSGPISSSFVNRFGCRLVTIGGAILGSVCMALSIFAPNVTTLYLTIGVGT
ncbi:unnamed protein product, partial [Timema podura]|nr:unnamed protein product [Timema podura]